MAEKNAAIMSYLRYILDESGMSPPQLASLAGISPSTLTRFLNSKAYKFTPSNTTIEKIAKATGVSPAPFYESNNTAELGLSPYVRNRLFPGNTHEGNLDSIIVIGDAQAGAWKETRLERVVTTSCLPIRYGSYANEDLFGLRMLGDSTNLIARPGDIIVCVVADKVGRHVFEGSLLIVERSTSEGRLIEVAPWYLMRKRGQWYLTHASEDAQRFNEVLHLGPASEDLDDWPRNPEGMKIIGIALFVWRDLPAALGVRE